MAKFAFIDGSGTPLYTAYSTNGDGYSDGALFHGMTIREFSEEVADNDLLTTGYYKDGWKTRTPRPNEIVVWNNDTEQWEDQRTAYELKTALVKDLARIRDEKLEGGFTWNGSTFQSDTAVSQPRLLGLFTTDLAGGIPPAGYPWRLADNSWQVLYPGDPASLWATFQQFMAALFAAFAAHEAAVLAETDMEVLRNYDVNAGWPV